MSTNNCQENEIVIFEIDNDEVFNTALATCQHSIAGGGGPL